jgi:hypothetical protein
MAAAASRAIAARERRRAAAPHVVTLVVGLLVLGISLLILLHYNEAPPVPAAFTRVGGATRVETAVEAARFWRFRPTHVVVTRFGSKRAAAWSAAKCAAVRDEPLVFTRGAALPAAITQRWPGITADADCLANPKPAYPSGLSTVGFDRNLPQIGPEKLASIVVFAVAKTPQERPDVAIGLALAAHLARAPQDVSLVVIPRYLEAAPKLENELRRHRQLVEGGVVLGQKGVLSEDTRALLRQVIAARDRNGILGELRSDLGSVQTVILAILALLGLAAAAGTAPQVVAHAVERVQERSSGRRGGMAENGMSRRFGREGVPLVARPERSRLGRGGRRDRIRPNEIESLLADAERLLGDAKAAGDRPLYANLSVVDDALRLVERRPDDAGAWLHLLVKVRSLADEAARPLAPAADEAAAPTTAPSDEAAAPLAPETEDSCSPDSRGGALRLAAELAATAAGTAVPPVKAEEVTALASAREEELWQAVKASLEKFYGSSGSSTAP